MISAGTTEPTTVILAMLKGSDVGLTPEELVTKGKAGGVDRPLKVTKGLIALGLARLDSGKNGRPDRIKATPEAWNSP